MGAGLLLPMGVLWHRAASWEAPERIVEEALALRPEMVVLPAGTFEMGSPDDEEGHTENETLHTVVLTQRFAVSRTEITQGQFAAVMGERPVETRADGLGRTCREAGVGDDLPVVCVDWLEAVRYCNELSKREGLEPAYVVVDGEPTWDKAAPGYRLLTEAEWEYAARAGTRTRFVGSDREEEVCAFSNFADASAKAQNPAWTTFACDDSFPALAPVGSLRPNPWFLLDLGGNVREWVWDTYAPYPEGIVRDQVSDSNRDSNRVRRGGSWWNGPHLARVADRNGDDPSWRLGYLGFRVARSLPSSL